MTRKKLFRGGVNIAMKIPKAHFEETVAFYRDVLGFELREETGEQVGRSYSLSFGPNRLWLDMVENYAQSDVWLELRTTDLEAAAEVLRRKGTATRDELERFPEGVRAHWISNPAGVVHLLIEEKKE